MFYSAFVRECVRAPDDATWQRNQHHFTQQKTVSFWRKKKAHRIAQHPVFKKRVRVSVFSTRPPICTIQNDPSILQNFRNKVLTLNLTRRKPFVMYVVRMCHFQQRTSKNRMHFENCSFYLDLKYHEASEIGNTNALSNAFSFPASPSCPCL